MPDVKLGYSINGFNTRRPNNQERALKAISVCGFRAVELRHQSTPAAPLGRPDAVELRFGSAYNFRGYLYSCGIDQVPSFFFNPELPATEEEAQDEPGSPTDAARHDAILESATSFTKLLHDLGGSCLVVNTISRGAPATEVQIKTVAECWNRVGKMTKEYGVQTAMHLDWQCAIRSLGDIERLLALTSSEVGLAIDTGDMTLAGVDPIALYEKHTDRVKHFHFKDTQGERGFCEMGAGKVKFPALLKSIQQHNYSGWIILEMEGGSSAQTTCMLNSWYVKRVLSTV